MGGKVAGHRNETFFTQRVRMFFASPGLYPQAGTIVGKPRIGIRRPETKAWLGISPEELHLFIYREEARAAFPPGGCRWCAGPVPRGRGARENVAPCRGKSGSARTGRGYYVGDVFCSKCWNGSFKCRDMYSKAWNRHPQAWNAVADLAVRADGKGREVGGGVRAEPDRFYLCPACIGT